MAYVPLNSLQVILRRPLSSFQRSVGRTLNVGKIGYSYLLKSSNYKSVFELSRTTK
jgi:hypothetical protein